MIDIHTHILFDIDDGSKSIEESIKIIKKYEKKGICDIVLTPHYIENSNYNADNFEKIKRYRLLKEEIKKQNIKVNIYLGNEVYLNSDMVNLIKNKEIMTINNSKYLLIELPFINENVDAINMIHDLKLSNIIPIIAHVERYQYISLSKIDEYRKSGAFIQINSSSIYNKYGNKAKKLAISFLKNNVVDFIATDTHHESKMIISSKKIMRKISKITNKKYAKEILIDNQLKVLKNEDI